MSQPRDSQHPFTSALLSMKVLLSIIEIGGNIQGNLKKKIENQVEGKCIAEGLVIPYSIQVVSYSAGKINMDKVEFQVAYSCEICLPFEGMEFECITKSITKAGIRAEYVYNGKPVIAVFVTRDENYENANFVAIKTVDTKIRVAVSGVSYELNDPYITATAELID